MRFAIAVLTVVFLLPNSYADIGGKQAYILNFDLDVNYPIGSDIVYETRLEGIHLSSEKPFHDEGLGEIDYFLSISESEDGLGRLTVEFYQFESRRKISDVISELVSVVDFSFGSPMTFKARNDEFTVDLAFIVSKK